MPVMLPATVVGSVLDRTNHRPLASGLHKHAHDYYLVIFEGDYVAGVTPKGGPVDSFVGVVPKAGNTVSIPKRGFEWAYNVDEKRYREIIVELKKS